MSYIKIHAPVGAMISHVKIHAPVLCSSQKTRVKIHAPAGARMSYIKIHAPVGATMSHCDNLSYA